MKMSFAFEATHHENLTYPPAKLPPPRHKALLRDYQPLISLDKALLEPYFLGVVALGGGYLRFPHVQLLFVDFFRRNHHSVSPKGEAFSIHHIERTRCGMVQ